MLRILFTTLLLLSSVARAGVEIGVGTTSTTSGRIVPGVIGGIRGTDWAFTGSAVGVATKYYYHSGYSASFYRTWKSEDFFWGATESGFGLGAYYAVRAFQDEGALSEEKSEDFALGPAFRVKWFFLNPIYLQMDGLFGLRSLAQIFTLQGQTNVVLSVGVAL